MGYIGNQITTVFPTSFTVTNATVEGAFTSQGIDDNADATAITIDNSENVGINTSSPVRAIHVESSNTLVGRFISTGSTEGFIQLGGSGTSTSPRLGATGNHLLAYTSDIERWRTDSSGNLLINTSLSSTDVGIVLGNNGQTTMKRGTLGDVQLFVNSGSGTQVGKIQIGGSSTNYITTSDHRLKENVTADWDATTRLKQLNPVRFNFIVDADTTVDGFLAHEVQSVVPEAISGTHNEVDDDGNPVYQGIDQSKLVPLLVKTIQELEARITALESA